MSSCGAPLGGRRRSKKSKKQTRRRRTRRGGGYGVAGAEQTAAGPFLAYGGISASGAELTSTAGNYGPVTGGRRRRSRRHRSRHRMRGGDASTNTGGEGRGGLSAGFQGTGVAGMANHSAVTTR
jgi:hypothetical protein